jgi:transposase
MSTNIFPSRSQAVDKILTEGELKKVLVVPIDFAKKTHVAQIAKGTGEYLRKRPFNVHNDVAGSQYLLEAVERCCAKYRIKKSRVVFGGEDPPEYVWNFVSSIQAAGYTFVRVNAKEAKKHRTNSRASSDALALDGIAQVMLLRRAYDLPCRDEVYGTMKLAERARRKLAKLVTAQKNRIHRTVDVLFPGFLNESLSGLLPFGESCVSLMEDGCSVVRIKRMRKDTLVKRLKAGHTHNSAKVAEKLKELANSALIPEPAMVPYQEKALATMARHLRSLRESLRVEENEMARCLAQSPGFLLTTIPGLGVVLSGGIIAEYGDPTIWRDPNRMASYAGIVCRQHQTGGPDSPPIKGKLPIDANHHAKDQLLQAAYHTGHNRHPAWKRLGLLGEHSLYEQYQSVELREGKSRLSTAKKLIRVVSAMIRSERIYLPNNALNPDAADAMSSRQYVVYQQIVAEMLTSKWKRYDLSGIPEEQNYLARWLQNTNELIKHSLDKNK